MASAREAFHSSNRPPAVREGETDLRREEKDGVPAFWKRSWRDSRRRRRGGRACGVLESGSLISFSDTNAAVS